MTEVARDETTALTPKWGPDGLLPAIAQDATSGEVLMLAYMNEEALRLTLGTGEAHYWSRSRGALWHKGATSGNIQRVETVLLDCDQDTILLKVHRAGPACHTGRETCFYRAVEAAPTAPTQDRENLNGSFGLCFI